MMLIILSISPAPPSQFHSRCLVLSGFTRTLLALWRVWQIFKNPFHFFWRNMGAGKRHQEDKSLGRPIHLSFPAGMDFEARRRSLLLKSYDRHECLLCSYVKTRLETIFLMFKILIIWRRSSKNDIEILYWCFLSCFLALCYLAML